MVEEDPQEFIDEVYPILYAMGFCTSEKTELSTYELKDSAQTLCVQWRDYRSLRGGPVTLEVFKKSKRRKCGGVQMTINKRTTIANE